MVIRKKFMQDRKRELFFLPRPFRKFRESQITQKPAISGACCGDTSDLLAQYLLDKGIKTDYVCGTYWGKPDGNGQSHAWLMVDKYIIIDITGDQFSGKSTFLNYDKSVYVGEGDDFHRLFEVEDRDVHEHRGLSALGGFCGPRLWDLYRKILKYI